MKTTFSKAIASTLLATGLAISFVAAPAQANSKKPEDSVKETAKSETLPAQPDNKKPEDSVKETAKSETLPAQPANSATENKQPETSTPKADKPDNSANGGGQGDSQNSSTNTVASAICNTSNVLLGGVQATACSHQTGNDTGKKGTLEGLLDGGLFNIGATADWTLAGKSDGNAGDFGFFAQNGLNQGKWGFKTALNTNTFVVSLKAGTAYSAYLFQNYDWSNGLEGVFNTIDVALDGTGKAGRALSHASVFVPDFNTPPTTSTEVPEPATLVGLGLAFGGMLSVRRRKSH